MLINIAFYLFITAIVIAVVQPKSKSEVWLYSVIVPLFLVFWVALFDSFFSDSYSKTSYKLASAFGESLVSIFISIPILFLNLRKKLTAREQFIFPKGIIVTIVVLIAIELCLQWASYRREKALEQNETEKNEAIGINSQIEEKSNETQKQHEKLNSEVIEARKILPELVEFLKQGLPATREGMSWTDVEIDNNALIYRITIDENVLNFNEITKDIESEKLEFFQSINAKNQQLINKLRLAKYNFYVEFKASNSKKTKWVTVLADEIQQSLIK